MTDDRKNNEAERPSEPAAPPAEDANADSLPNAVGAYLLDALPDEERAAFESYLATSTEAQSELRALAPVVALLPRLLDLEAGDGEGPVPAPELRDRLLTAALAERAVAPGSPEQAEPDSADVAERVTEPTAIRQIAPATRRPQGRIRSGFESTPEAPTLVSLSRRLPAAWLAAAAITLVAIGAILWALALQSRIDSKDREIKAQAAQINRYVQTTNATSYTLSADAGTSGQAGTLLFSLKDQIGVLYVRELPKLDPGKVYQLWYLDDDSPQTPRPGGTFEVDANGNGFVAVAADTPTFDAVALTAEPKGGSKAPTSGIVLQGRLGGAAG